MAATDTTAVTLTWILSLLLNNREALEKVQQELDLQVGRDRPVEESDIKNLIYLQAVIKETLRLYPAGPLSVPHEAMSDCVVAGYDIKAGTRLLIHIYKIQRDPSVWTDPLEFRPERFLTTHKDFDVRGQTFEFMPFGSGRRMCPGVSFALQTMSLALASLLQGFNLRTPLDEPVDMTEGLGLTMLKATPLQPELSPRLPHDCYVQSSV